MPPPILAQEFSPASPPRPVPDPVEGIWLGPVRAPQGPEEIGFRFERDAKGGLGSALFFPVMNAYGVKCGAPVGGGVVKRPSWRWPHHRGQPRLFSLRA
ncbi:MAG: hypothetical protein PSW75_12050 [bacterium]|nr:hypothetical protein [bacterium]